MVRTGEDWLGMVRNDEVDSESKCAAQKSVGIFCC